MRKNSERDGKVWEMEKLHFETEVFIRHSVTGVIHFAGIDLYAFIAAAIQCVARFAAIYGFRRIRKERGQPTAYQQQQQSNILHYHFLRTFFIVECVYESSSHLCLKISILALQSQFRRCEQPTL